jgi:Domain of unknown function (DUF1848)
VIISASYRTDIPAFYGEWFMNRLQAGYCKVVNPYNRKSSAVGLSRDKVRGIVFWTKNLGPFVHRLGEVRELGFPFVVQYSINGYPRELEVSVVDTARSVGHVKWLAKEFGPRVAVWRYDPVLLSSLTDERFHCQKFRSLCEQLEGSTNEVVFSFVQIYDKTRRNLDHVSQAQEFTWSDPPDLAKKAILQELASIATSYGFAPKVCSQPEFATDCLSEAHCVDADRLAAVAGEPIVSRVKGNRPECACHECRDIGEYDTCPHGCVYCYAVKDRELAKMRHRQHDPASEYLFPPSQGTDNGGESGEQLVLIS